MKDHSHLLCAPSVFTIKGDVKGFAGCAITLDGNTARVVFNHDSGKVLNDQYIKI